MARKETDHEFLARVREWFRVVSSFEAEMRRDMLDDLKFVRLGGEHQWPDYAIASRKVPGQERPVLTDNRVKRYRTIVINQMKESTPAIKVRPADDRADKKTADILQGVIRNIESVGRAAVAIDKATEYAVDCGRGYFAITTKYVSDDAFDQEIMFRMIPDSFKVYLDPWSVEPDGSDARRAMIVSDMPRELFKRSEGVDIQEWGEGAEGDSEWLSQDSIRVAEYFEIESTPADLVLTADGRTVWADELSHDDIAVRTRRTTRDRCRWYKIAGNQILEQSELPTKYIPVIPIYGEECWIEGRRHVNGLVRSAKSPQILLNFWLSAVAEQVALQPKVPWVGAAGAFDGHEAKWRTANTVNHAYLEYEPITAGGTSVPAPSRQPPPPIPTGYTEQINIALDGIRAAVGMEDPMIGAGQGPNQSGRAIRSLMEQGNVATFHFTDARAKSVAHAGRILIDMIPEVYSTARVLRILGEDGEADTIEHDAEMHAPYLEERDQQGAIRRIYNIGVGRYDCIATAGPSYSTKRQEGFDALTQLVQAMPQLSQLAGDLIIRLSDMPYADEMADRLRAALPPEIIAATETDGADPQLMAAQQQIMQLMQQIQAMAVQLQAAQDDQALKAGELQVKQYDAETKRMQALRVDGGVSQDDMRRKAFDLDEALTRLMLEVERGEREQERHDMAIQAPYPVPAANALQGGNAITGE